MLLPDDLDPAPPLTDKDLDAYFEWEDRQGVPVWDDEAVTRLDEMDMDPPPASRFQIYDLGAAEWAMRHAAHTTAAVEEIKEQAEEFRAQVKLWEERELAPLKRRVGYFTALLTDFARRRREEGQKSLNLPSGSVTSRLNPARPSVTDEEAFIAFAEYYLPSDVVKVKKSPVMAAIKAHVAWTEGPDGEVFAVYDGEVVPGVVQVPEEISFTIKPAKP